MRVALRHMIVVSPRHGRLKQRTRRLMPIRPSHANELWYRKRLLTIVEAIILAVKQSNIVEFLKPMAVIRDAAPMAVMAMLQRLAVAAGGLTAQAAELAGIAVRQNLKGVDERLIASIKQSIHLDVSGLLTENFALRSAMDRALAENIDLITSIPAQYLDRVQDIIAENMAEGFRWESLVDEIEQAGDITRTRAKIIARDQTSKMNGRFNEARQQSLGIERYEWQTSGDERVRDSHAEHDGKIFRWDDPPEDTGHPGEDIMCRCTAIPIVDLEGGEAE